MNINESVRKLRRNLFPMKVGALLLMLLCLVAVAWGRLEPPASEEEAALRLGLSPAKEPEEAPTQPQPLSSDEQEAQVAAAYFAAYRLDREEARSQELILLEEIIGDENSSAEAVGQAEQRRLEIAAYSDQENQAESLLAAKGFGETVVILGTQLATVIVDVEMNAQKATQIAEAVDSVSGCGFENVVVVNR